MIVFVFASFSLNLLLHFRSKCDPYHCRFWVTFELLLCHFWITLEHKVTASRSWALGARCEDYPSCRAHFARRAGTTRRMGHAHFARWAGTTRQHVVLYDDMPNQLRTIHLILQNDMQFQLRMYVVL